MFYWMSLCFLNYIAEFGFVELLLQVLLYLVLRLKHDNAESLTQYYEQYIATQSQSTASHNKVCSHLLRNVRDPISALQLSCDTEAQETLPACKIANHLNLKHVTQHFSVFAHLSASQIAQFHPVSAVDVTKDAISLHTDLILKVKQSVRVYNLDTVCSLPTSLMI